MSQDPDPYTHRQARLSAALQRTGLEALALNPGPSLVYLTGLNFHLMERPVIAIFAPQAAPTLVMPELETAKAAALPFPAQVFPYGEDPSTWQEVFKRAMQAGSLDGRQIGVEPTRLRFLELRFLEGAAPAAHFVSAEQPLAELRMCKDEQEIAHMRRAVQIAQQALQAVLPQIKPGLTERQIAGELTLQLLKAGSEAEFPFAPIVSGGPNSANPHAAPSDRPLQTGDLLVIDWGAIYQGYISDITRTFAIGPLEDELAAIHRIVEQANAAGRAAAGPGVTAEAVDQAARQVIEAASYGPYFIHRTGHGIGMEGHEGPYIRTGSQLRLQPGMTFTIEPGIYLPGRGGVRIEDDMLITPQGAASLSDLPRGLTHLE
ncbi:MAG: aminopeptidase P family protein [Anaerolineales bacterium]|nr:aminopeptidase P family protein [Anaerolineales bacterium]